MILWRRRRPLAAASPASDDDLASGDLLGAGTATAAPEAPTPIPAPAVESKSAEDWVAAGGWYRPPESFTLFYRPSGHADPFLVAWLTAAAQLSGRPDAPNASEAFHKLADPQNPGLCMKCHTPSSAAARRVVHWLPIESEPKGQTFTTFNHSAHLSLFGDAGCQMCHVLDPKADYAKYFSGTSGAEANRDPTRFASNFSAFSKTLCLQCHQPKVAGDSCVLCHRYHSGPAVSRLVAKRHFETALPPCRAK